MDSPVVEAVSFARLIEFFLKRGTEDFVCRNILGQMQEAARQQTWQASELLVSTILEAALRTLDNHPFRDRDHSWKINQSMDLFRCRYLAKEWTEPCERALEAHRRLRHRNAHPDWLFEEGRRRSEVQKTDVLRDISFLSRFYGYMIMALAGFTDLKPEFS
jgi:hypothetical protein